MDSAAHDLTDRIRTINNTIRRIFVLLPARSAGNIFCPHFGGLREPLSNPTQSIALRCKQLGVEQRAGRVPR